MMNTKSKSLKKILAIFSIILLFGTTVFTGCDDPNKTPDPTKVENEDDSEKTDDSNKEEKTEKDDSKKDDSKEKDDSKKEESTDKDNTKKDEEKDDSKKEESETDSEENKDQDEKSDEDSEENKNPEEEPEKEPEEDPDEITGKIQDVIDNAVAGTTVVLGKNMEGTELSITRALTVNGNGLKDISISVDAQVSGNVKLKNFRNAKVSIKANDELRASMAGSSRSAYGSFEGQAVTLSEEEMMDQEIKSAQELFGSIYGDEHRFTVEDCTFEEFNVEEDIALMISTKGENPCEFEKINVKEGVEDFYIIEKDNDDALTAEKGRIKELNFESSLSDFAMVGSVVEDVKYDEKADFRFVYDEETTELPEAVQKKVSEDLDAKDVQYTGILDDKNVITGSKYSITFPRENLCTDLEQISIYFYPKEKIEAEKDKAVDYEDYLKKEALTLWKQDKALCKAMYPELNIKTKNAFVNAYVTDNLGSGNSNRKISQYENKGIEETDANPLANSYVLYGRNVLERKKVTYDEFGCELFEYGNGLYIPFNPDRTVIKDYHVYQRRNPQAISGVYVKISDTTVTYYVDLEKIKSTDISLEGHLWNGYYIDKLTPVNLAGYAPYASVSLENSVPDSLTGSYVYGGTFELKPCPDSEWPTEAELSKAITNFENETFGDIGIAFIDQAPLYREFEARVNGIALSEIPTHNLMDDSFRKDTDTILNAEQTFSYVVKEDCKSIEMTLQDDTGDYWCFVTQPDEAPKATFEFYFDMPDTKEVNTQELYQKAYAEAEEKYYAPFTLVRSKEEKKISLPGVYKKDTKYTFTFKYHVDTTNASAIERKVYWKAVEEEERIEFLPYYSCSELVSFEKQGIDVPNGYTALSYDNYYFCIAIPNISNSETKINYEHEFNISNPYIKLYKDRELTKEIKDVSEIKPYKEFWSDICYIDAVNIEKMGYDAIYVLDTTPYVRPMYLGIVEKTPNFTTIDWVVDDYDENYACKITSFAPYEKVYLDKEKTKLFTTEIASEVKPGDTVYVDNGNWNGIEDEICVYIEGETKQDLENFSVFFDRNNKLKYYWKDAAHTIPFTAEELDGLYETLTAKDAQGKYVVNGKYCIYTTTYNPDEDTLLYVYTLPEGADKSVQANWTLTTMQKSELISKASAENVYVFGNLDDLNRSFDDFDNYGVFNNNELQEQQLQGLTGRKTEDYTGKPAGYDPYELGFERTGPVYLYTDNENHIYIFDYNTTSVSTYTLETLIGYIQNGTYAAYKDNGLTQMYTIAELQSLATTPGFHTIYFFMAPQQ